MVKSFARFSPFSRGRIIGKAEEGARRKKIRKEVRKKDGKQASFRAIDGVVACRSKQTKAKMCLEQRK